MERKEEGVSSGSLAATQGVGANSALAACPLLGWGVVGEKQAELRAELSVS